MYKEKCFENVYSWTVLLLTVALSRLRTYLHIRWGNQYINVSAGG
jgi:hypothetical protein